jgi:hypothetical protein
VGITPAIYKYMPQNREEDKTKNQTISEYFKLKKSQYDLDFFDAYIAKDTPLFIDPWAIRTSDDDFSINAYQKIHSVFEQLIEFIKNNKETEALELLNNLHEPSETGLGYAKNSKAGSGVGEDKSLEIYKALSTSKAVKSGLLTDLEDTALHIEGIGNDNISDIVTNIIRLDLIKYTQEQCDLYGIQMLPTQTKMFWDEDIKEFTQKNEERTLIIDGKKILLVPKKIIRRKLSINYTDFYLKGILEFEQARHYDARTSLCRTLKGRIVAKPYKKTLIKSKKYDLSRDLVFNYINQYPELLEKYKNQKANEISMGVENTSILKKQKRIDTIADEIKEKIDKLNNIPRGMADASTYHKHIHDCLNTIFNNPGTPNYLSNPRIEDKYNDGRKRIDVTFHNNSNSGFFSRLSNYGSLFCAKIFFECKNYTQDINNTAYDQMIGRFNNRTSTIGYIICRSIEDKQKCIETCKDFVMNGRGFIMVLTDADIIKLLEATSHKNRDNLIDKILHEKIDEIVQ